MDDKSKELFLSSDLPAEVLKILSNEDYIDYMQIKFLCEEGYHEKIESDIRRSKINSVTHDALVVNWETHLPCKLLSLKRFEFSHYDKISFRNVFEKLNAEEDERDR